MPLIAPQLKQLREPLTIRLDVQLITLLKRYSEYIASSSEYVVSQVLLMTLGQDHEFGQWLQGKHPEDAGAWHELRGRQRPAARRPNARQAVRNVHMATPPEGVQP